MRTGTRLTVTGNLTTNAVLRELPDGTHVVDLGLAHNDRRQDRDTGLWQDGATTFYTVTCWRKLADNVATSLQKGDPVVVEGTFSINEYERRDGTLRTELKIQADTVGVDLSRSMVSVVRRPRPAVAQPVDQAASSVRPTGDAVSTEPWFRPGGGADHGVDPADLTPEPELQEVGASGLGEPVPGGKE